MEHKERMLKLQVDSQLQIAKTLAQSQKLLFEKQMELMREQEERQMEERRKRVERELQMFQTFFDSMARIVNQHGHN